MKTNSKCDQCGEFTSAKIYEFSGSLRPKGRRMDKEFNFHICQDCFIKGHEEYDNLNLLNARKKTLIFFYVFISLAIILLLTIYLALKKDDTIFLLSSVLGFFAAVALGVWIMLYFSELRPARKALAPDYNKSHYDSNFYALDYFPIINFMVRKLITKTMSYGHDVYVEIKDYEDVVLHVGQGNKRSYIHSRSIDTMDSQRLLETSANKYIITATSIIQEGMDYKQVVKLLGPPEEESKTGAEILLNSSHKIHTTMNIESLAEDEFMRFEKHPESNFTIRFKKGKVVSVRAYPK